MKRGVGIGLGVLGLTVVVGTAAGATSANGTPPTAFTVDRFLAHWWVFPAAVAFSLVALAAGVSGALFFSPFFMLVVGLIRSCVIPFGTTKQKTVSMVRNADPHGHW